jgi:Tol biopolymer transport system component
VFRSNRSGSDEIWIASADGQNPERLTHIGGAATGLVAGFALDRVRLACGRGERGARHGGRARRREKQVTDGAFNALAPAWSHDGYALYFCSRRTGR